MKFDWDSLDGIDKKFIFKYLTQESIFEHYLRIPVDEEFHVNPLRNDKYPDCKFFYGQNGRLWFIDFADQNRRYDCFNVVQTLFHCNYYTACRIIANDFGLLDYNNPNRIELKEEDKIKRERRVVKIRIKRKKYFPKEALAFWEQFKLNLSREELVNELNIHGIFVLDAAWLQYEDLTLKQVYDYSKYNPAFVYYLDDNDNYQLYYPYNGKNGIRFMQTTNSILHFYKQLPERGEYLVVTKSRKDSFLLRQFGINSIAVISERGKIDKNVLINLKLRFTYLFCLFDNDRTGVRATIRMREDGFIPLFIPKEYGKDFADALLELGVEGMSELIEETKEKFEIYG